MKHTAIVTVGCAIVVGAVFGASGELSAAKEPITRSGHRAPARQESSDGGEGASRVDVKPLEAKLNQILENQEKILQRFDQVMEELRIIKIRATLR